MPSHYISSSYCNISAVKCSQPDPKHGIVLTEDALRPCRAGVESSPRASVRAGDGLYLSWMGNGHAANGQSDGTCVKMMLAPYESDPDFASFVAIPGGECVPYWYTNAQGFVKTEHTITIPADTAPERYTLLWYWDFTEFWYSSCSDIDVLPASDGVPTSQPSATPTKAPTGIPTKEPTSPSYTSPPQTYPPTTNLEDMQTYQTTGCTHFAEPDKFCQSYLGTSSYCKHWNQDECNRSVCQGGDFLLPCPTEVTTPSPTSSPVTSPTMSGFAPIDTYRAGGCTDASLSTDFCTAYFGGNSYCKGGGLDACGRAVCQGDAHSNLDPCLY